MKSVTIQDIKDFKNASSFAALTAYDFNSAQILDEAEWVANMLDEIIEIYQGRGA